LSKLTNLEDSELNEQKCSQKDRNSAGTDEEVTN